MTSEVSLIPLLDHKKNGSPRNVSVFARSLVPTTGAADGMFWWWGVLYSFYSSFFKTLHGRWVLEYLFSPQSIILLVRNSTAHGNMACVRSAQQIRWRWGWGDWCGLEDRRAEHVLPATCRQDTTTKEKPTVPVRIPPTCVFSVHLWHPLHSVS